MNLNTVKPKTNLKMKKNLTKNKKKNPLKMKMMMMKIKKKEKKIKLKDIMNSGENLEKVSNWESLKILQIEKN